MLATQEPVDKGDHGKIGCSWPVALISQSTSLLSLAGLDSLSKHLSVTR